MMSLGDYWGCVIFDIFQFVYALIPVVETAPAKKQIAKAASVSKDELLFPMSDSFKSLNKRCKTQCPPK